METEITERTVAQEERRNGERTEKTNIDKASEGELSSPFNLRCAVSPVSPFPPRPPCPVRPSGFRSTGEFSSAGACRLTWISRQKPRTIPPQSDSFQPVTCSLLSDVPRCVTRHARRT